MFCIKVITNKFIVYFLNNISSVSHNFSPSAFRSDSKPESFQGKIVVLIPPVQ